MAQIETLRTLALRAGHADMPVPMKRRAMGTAPYDAAGHGRRGLGWNPSRLGQNTLLYSHGLDLVARSRDAVRNSPWAAAAVDSYCANAIGRGIRLVPQHPNEGIRDMILARWNRWTRESDVEYDPANPSSGQTDWYGQQMIVAREVMEAGECFIRFHVRKPSERLSVRLQLQLIESEQLPIWRMSVDDLIPKGNVVRSGIEFRPDMRRAAYHFYKAHPFETMFFPEDALAVERVPAPDILHVYKPVRAGQFRGQPWLTSVLAKLYELDKLQDAELVRRSTAAMIVGFIKQAAPDNPILPPDPQATSAGQTSEAPESGVQISKLEPGTFPVLNPGEEMQFAEAKDPGNYESFARACLRAFAAGSGLTFEQISGDLSQLNFSSIRAGLLEMRRKCEQFQHAVFIFQVCHPVYRRWLYEAMMSLTFGAKLMQEYVDDPEPFELVEWVTPGWPWVDPVKDIEASKEAIRCGLSTRSAEVAAQGRDAAAVDREQTEDNRRADEWKLSYDSDGRKVLTGRNAGLTEAEISEDANAAAHDEKGQPQLP